MSSPEVYPVQPVQGGQHNDTLQQPSVEKKHSFFGYIWKKIMEVSAALYALIARIGNAVKSILSPSEKPQSTLIKIEATVEQKGNKGGPAVDVFAKTLAEGQCSSKEGQVVPNDEQVVPDKEKEEADQAASGDASNLPNKSGFNVESDPFLNMGVLAPDNEVYKPEMIPVPLKEVNDDFGIANELTTIVYGLLEQVPDSWHNLEALIQQLNIERGTLELNEHDLKGILPGEAQKLELAIQAIDKKMVELGNAIYLKAQAAIEELDKRKPENLHDYLVLVHELTDLFGAIQPFAFAFEHVASEGAHLLIQGMITALEMKKHALDAAMCQFAQAKYKPNHGIGLIGNCLFESIGHQLGNQEGQKEYRELAVKYLRANLKTMIGGEFQTFEEGILDAMKTEQGDEGMKLYAESLAESDSELTAIQQWAKRLEEKLGRKVNQFDFYFDCMENHTFWGGSNEILALSEMLKRPILVFTNAGGGEWVFDLMAGTSKYGDKAPILLYFNGINHYQDLISK